jgi:hypothetical protein
VFVTVNARLWSELGGRVTGDALGVTDTETGGGLDDTVTVIEPEARMLPEDDPFLTTSETTPDVPAAPLVKFWDTGIDALGATLVVVERTVEQLTPVPEQLVLRWKVVADSPVFVTVNAAADAVLGLTVIVPFDGVTDAEAG